MWTVEPPTPLENQNVENRALRSDLSWPKLGLEPKFQGAGTFGGFGKQITHRQTDKIYVL